MTTNSDLLTRVHEEHLMAALAVVLTHPTGFNVELDGGDAWMESRDGQFLVRYLVVDTVRPELNETDKHVETETFNDVREAINYFLDLRDLQLGADQQTDAKS